MKKRASDQLSDDLERFVRQYERRAQKGVEPNDRRYDRKIEKQMKRLRPEELSALLYEERVDAGHPQQSIDDAAGQQ